jgi:hypothetical protein
VKGWQFNRNRGGGNGVISRWQFFSSWCSGLAEPERAYLSSSENLYLLLTISRFFVALFYAEL